MNNQRISVSLDVTKLDKSKFVVGSKGTYVDLILIPVDGNRYGDDFAVKQDIKSADLPAGSRGIIIGNARFLKPKESVIPF